ncbi:hypothetical protein GCM10011514_06120 [Emticicia aquatilis]|uniref:Uncharacterized protein n=1 Tax=Emticicia aquatilis TaxID=1537369 RepID=A0A917DJH9_9BACT|nr:hypothetical protein [Emticicia aquatilis]GGD44883.1 hypothetical protein GCM10011514_06120 [Emticicia aquatilis]
MKRIIAAIQIWIDKNIPSEVILKECHVRRLHALFTNFYKEIPATQVAETARAIDRLTAQLPLQSECSCKPCAFLIYEADKKALKQLCNSYCLWIAENYEAMPWFPRLIASVNYEDFTNIMTSIK